MKIFGILFLLLIIGAIVYFGLIPWTQWSEYSVPITSLLPQSDKAEQPQPEDESDLEAFLAFVMIGSGLGAVFGRNVGCAAIFIICCVIEFFIDYNFILLVLLVIFVLAPMGLVAIVSSMFRRN